MIDNEESILLDQLQSARHAVELAKKAVSVARTKQNEAEAALEVMNQAVADYFIGNGLLQFEANGLVVELGKSYSVDIADPAAVPEEYMRTKTVSEPDKVKIRNEAPRDANWYVMKESNKITVRGK